MATGMFGANPDELRAVGGEFGVAAGLLESSGATVGAEIAGVRWLGVDATLYRANWGTVIPGHLSELGGVLETVKTDLDRQAGDQEDASQRGNGNEGCANSIGNGLKSVGNALGNFLKGVVIDGIWGDIKGLGALIGFDENGWSLTTMKETWKGMGALVGFDKNGKWSLDTLTNTWKEVGKDFLAWDQWKTDPAGALGKVVWNVGSMFIGVGEAKMLAKAGAVSDAGRIANVAADAGRVADVAADAGRIADVAADAGRVADAAGDAGRIADAAGDAGRVADAAGDAGHAADAATDAARAADNAPWAADNAGAAGRVDDVAGGADEAAAASRIDPSTLDRADRAPIHKADPDFGRMEWNTKEGMSPDVLDSPRTLEQGAVDWKMERWRGPYDTGAHIDADGNLVSTSGRTFTPDQVSHHWSSATGSYNKDLLVGNGPEGMPFKPDHRYVLDGGKTVIETNEFGVPDYNRFHVDTFAPREGTDGMFMRKDFDHELGQFVKHTDARSSAWGGLNQGVEVPSAGHAHGRGTMGPFEDLNQIPQNRYANGELQLGIEEAFRAEASVDRPIIVERRTEFSHLQAPNDPNTVVSGPAIRHTFDVTDARTGEPIILHNKNGQPMDMSIPDGPGVVKP